MDLLLPLLYLSYNDFLHGTQCWRLPTAHTKDRNYSTSVLCSVLAPAAETWPPSGCQCKLCLLYGKLHLAAALRLQLLSVLLCCSW